MSSVGRASTYDGAGTPRPGRRDLLLGAAFYSVAAVTFVRLPRRHLVAVPLGRFDGVIPARFGGWHAAEDEGFVMPLEDLSRRSAKVYQDQLMRTYEGAGNERVMFVVAYDRRQSGMLMVHRPESCYPGSGFTITATRDIALQLTPGRAIAAKFLSTRRGERVEQVLYWTRVGDRFPLDWDAQRADLMMQNLKGVIPDGALVRMSIIETDADAALATLRRFAETLFESCGPIGQALLSGPISPASA